MNTLLEKEQFDSVKELSKIQMAISDGRANLIKLKDNTEKFLVKREVEAQKRVVKVLEESRDSLENISKNHDQLTQYREELEAYAIILNDSSQIIMAFFENFNKRIDTADQDMKDHYTKVKEVQKQIKVDNAKIESDRRLLAGEMRILENETRLLKDRRETLDRGFKELRKLKDKKDI